MAEVFQSAKEHKAEAQASANRITQVDPIVGQITDAFAPLIRKVVQEELLGTPCTVSLTSLDPSEVEMIASRVADILEACQRAAATPPAPEPTPASVEVPPAASQAAQEPTAKPGKGKRPRKAPAAEPVPPVAEPSAPAAPPQWPGELVEIEI